MYPLICHDLGFLGLLPMLFNMLDVTEAYDNVALHMPSYQSYPDYNNYAENDLCEVEVYGCPTVNPDCDEWDPMMCACLVCKPSYMYIEPQHETTDWPIGSYGYYYDEMCGHCKDPTQCSPYTGICLTGCSAGYFGPSCKEECHIGNYGYNCNETCGHCKDLSQCSTTSGFCHTGCSYGYTGGLCKKKCDIGLYGDLCNDTCGHCIDPAECNHIVRLVIMGIIATRRVATVMNQHNVLLSLEPVELDVKKDIQEDFARTNVTLVSTEIYVMIRVATALIRQSVTMSLEHVAQDVLRDFGDVCA
uniref:Scavenger receptor class F member 2 n=1 Tax=Magallana gigas TaxID=29159 RepID=A0A8W8NQK8_MAGGI